MRSPSTTFFFEGDDYFEALHESIDGARSTIDIEIYYFASDEIGWGIARRLIKKASEGVAIRVLFDDVGCRGTSRELFDELTEAGIAVRPYNAWLPTGRHVGRRNHRKIATIDGQIAFLGGFNWSSEFSHRLSGNKAWRDTGVRLEQYPRCLSRLHEFFEETWRGRRRTLKDYIRRRLYRADWREDSLHVVPNHGWRRKSPIREEYLSAIVHAKDRILITSAYFVPDGGIRRALRRAARRGVDVCLLTAGKTDVRIARWAGQATYAALLRAGVRIFEYGTRILHAKTAVVDDDRFTIGTANLDHLSFFQNLEANLFGKDPVSAGVLATRFEKDLLFAQEIRREDWRRRPWWARLFERFFFLFRVWL